MPLSEAEKLYNRTELDTIQVQLISVFHFDPNSPEAMKLKNALIFAGQELEKNSVLLSLKEGQEKLYKLIANCLQLNKKEEVIQHQIRKWIANYRRLERQDKKNLQTIVQQQSDGILDSLKKHGPVSEGTWMNGTDLERVLKTVVTSQDNIKTPGTYLLSPIDIVPGPHATKEEKDQPHLSFLNHIAPVIKNVPGHMKFVMPVNLGQSHWLVGIIKVNHHKIQRATIWDPAKSDLTVARNNMQTAVNLINQNEKVKVKSKSAGIQKNAHSCGDYAAQKCLKELHKEQLLPKTKNADILRGAVIAEIVKNSPELKTPTPQPMVREDQLEEDIFVAFAQANQKDLVKKQIAFDEMMARALDNIYQQNPEQKDAVKQARKMAFIQFQKTFGFFKYVPQEKTTAAPFSKLKSKK